MRVVRGEKERESQIFNYQFKHTVVTITDHPNIQLIDIAEALAIYPAMLYRWRQETREGKLENNEQAVRSRDKLLQAENKSGS